MIRLTKSLLIICAFALGSGGWENQVWGQQPQDPPAQPIPGLIPRFYSIEAATDLPISPEVAHEKAKKGELDLSLLEPDKNTNIWNPTSKKITDANLVKSGDTVEYTGDLASRIGSYRFTVRTQDNKELVLLLSKKAHNLLLRKNILEKIGFQVPQMNWAATLRVKFKNTIDRDLFLEEMTDRLLANQERWLVEKKELEVTLQDVMATTSENNTYNLALGIMNSEVHMGRRLLRAPYVPIALVDTPESINFMPWQAGRLVMEQIKLYHSQDIATTFGTSFEDAQWIGRRIGKLDRTDFQEIVEKAYLPKPVSILILEKIVSRRNDLMKLLKLEKEFSDLNFEPAVNFESSLVNGEITQEFFDGYSSRFSFGDPESPFNASELGAYALSELQSHAFTTALSELNYYMGTHEQDLYKDKLTDIVKKKGPGFPVSVIVVPSIHGEIILSRDIILGSYLGTNNKVQLVDNIGVSLDAGVTAGIEGLPIPIQIQGHGGIAIQRLYSHIKPVQTLKKSLKEPYKNLMVPLILKGIANNIDKISNVTDPAETEKKIQEVIGELKKSIGVGESFVVTDSIVPNLGLRVGGSLPVGDPKLLKIYGEAGAQRLMLSRFHFFRASEDVFHIYQDKATGTRVMVSVGLKSYVPILKINARWANIGISTDYFPITLNAAKADVSVLKALRTTLLAHNDQALEGVVKPHHIDNKISEQGATFQFLFFKSNRIGSDRTIAVTHADYPTPFYLTKRFDAFTDGVDYENYAIEAINEIISVIGKIDSFSFANSAVINPGYTIGGRARNRVFTSEFDGKRFVTTYQRVFNGWRASQKRMRNMMDEINNEYGEVVFNELSYRDVSAILLYNITLQTTISAEGVERLLELNEADIRNLLKNSGLVILLDRDIGPIVRRWQAQIRKAKALLDSSPTYALAEVHGLLNSMYQFIRAKSLEAVMGSQNVAFMGRIDGYREGAENGDSPIFSNMTGALPIQLQSFPSAKIMNVTGISEGELMGNWVAEQAL